MNSKAVYDKVAKDYDKQIGDKGDVLHEKYIIPVVEKFLGKVKGKKVLDLACGQGYLSRILAKKGAKVTGLDISRGLLEIANKIENKKKLGINYVQGNAMNLKNIYNEKFDFVVSNMALIDIPNGKKVFEEVYKVLKKKGVFVFSITHPFTTAPEKTEYLVKENNNYFFKASSYNEEYSISKPVPDSKGKIIHYHRPIEYYINSLAKSGLFIKEIKEISAFHYQGKKIKDKKFKDFRKKFPVFMAFKCEK
jgi:ubiquinone/menaquinone biosynthesis C-methylase UbiE